jgi:hypothetical protein
MTATEAPAVAAIGLPAGFSILGLAFALRLATGWRDDRRRPRGPRR